MKPKVTCGLEIHQQLKIRKLFCECDSIIRTEEPAFTVERRLRAAIGESGEVDIAAAEEARKKKTFVYEGYDEHTCLVELDEAPPGTMRKEALRAALMVGKLFRATFVDEVQVMRKAVADGSNTTGFQRTGLIAHSGTIESSQGPISIPTVILEEDSARRIKTEQDKVTFRLDRLGIPLLEISTGPDMHSPEQCQEVAEKMGILLRSTGLVRRGLGTIRQDVNVSIEGGERVEIKGAQDLKLMPTLVELEALRQENLLEIKKELAKRKVTQIKQAPTDVSKHLRESKSKVVQSALKKGGTVLALLLSNWKGLLGKEVQPKRRMGTELSERAKVAAGVGGLFHSDELPNYGITPGEVEMIQKHLKAQSNDAFILVADGKHAAERAMEAALERANEAIKGVPREVRAANPDGTTRFLRKMPGAARMYPETDVLPVRLDEKTIDAVKLPELIDAKIKRYEKLGLGKDLAELVAKSAESALFDECMKKVKNLKPAYVAEVLMTSERAVKSQFKVDINPSDDDYKDLLIALDQGKLTKESALEVLKENKPVKEIISKYKTMSDADIKKVLKKIVDANKGAPFNALIGKAMAQLRGKAPGQKVAELLKQLAS